LQPDKGCVLLSGLPQASSGMQLEISAHWPLEPRHRPLAAFSGKKAALVNESGFQTPVVFASKEALPEKVRLRVFFEGVKRPQVRLSAVYVR